jgi:membrane protease YdiL (CAAX protease family)
MEGFPINIPTLYLDCILLAAVAYPSGLSYSLFVSWKGAPRQVSTGLLALLALPYLIVIPAVWALSSGLLSSLITLHTLRWTMLVLAVILVPIAFAIEYAIHGFAIYRASGRFPRGLGVQKFWQKGLSPLDHFLLVLVAAGEEVFYRLVWLGILLSLHLPWPLALLISSIGYGLNHLSFGKMSVFSKSVSGLIYGALFLFGGSIWLPILTHSLQNFMLFQLTKERHA